MRTYAGYPPGVTDADIGCVDMTHCAVCDAEVEPEKLAVAGRHTLYPG